MNWEKVGKPVPAKVVDAMMASHFKAVAPALRRNDAWRMQSQITARNDVACTGNCCGGQCDCDHS